LLHNQEERKEEGKGNSRSPKNFAKERHMKTFVSEKLRYIMKPNEVRA